MDFQSALLVFTTQLMDRTNHNMSYDKDVAAETVAAVSSITADPSEAETLIKIARWESGGFRKDVANCKVKGDHNQAYGLWQVHPRNQQETAFMCTSIQGQASIALERIRESAHMCEGKGMKGSDLLGGYTVGTCNKNDRAARLRWGNGKEIVRIMMEN